MEGSEPKRVGTPTKAALYSKVSMHAYDMIKILADIAKNGDNDNAKVAAARTLLNKAIPDLKAVEVSGDNLRPLIIKLDAIPELSTKATGSMGSSKE